MRLPGKPIRALLALLGAALTVALGAPSAMAQGPAYQYWGYYHLSGHRWTFATKGPAQTLPANGSVEGYRFAISSGTVSRPPRDVLTFDQICGWVKTAKHPPYGKAVGVVLDFGRPADAPQGATPPKPTAICALVDASATGDQVLAHVARTRVVKGLICGIDGYPQSGCAPTLKTEPAAAKAKDVPITITPQHPQSSTSSATPTSSTPSRPSSASTPGLSSGQAGTSAGTVSNGSSQAAVGNSSTTGPGSGVPASTWVGIGVTALVLLGLGMLALRRRRTGTM